MNELVLVKSNDAVTTSLIIAEGTGNQHRAVAQLIRKYSENFKRLGSFEFTHLKCRNLEKATKRGRPTKVYYLTEPQATFLVTLLDNNETVVAFKEELVRQFYQMKSVLLERKTESWLNTRKVGILARKAETDVIKQLVEYAKSLGSTHSDMLYITYTRLANSMAGIKNREYANVMQLNLLNQIEGIILKVIRLGMDAGKHYKEIYKDCKERLTAWLEMGMIDVGLLGGE